MNEFPPKDMIKVTQEQLDSWKQEMDDLLCCPICKEKLHNTNGFKEVCYSCKQKQKQKAKSDWLANHALDNTIEQRLRMLESWMYDHQRAKHSSPFDMIMR